MEKRKLAVIDDDVNMRSFLLTILGEKWEVNIFGNGYEAIKFFQENGSPDLILLDLEMPDMTGFEMVKYLKSSFSLKSVPVVILSANATSKDKIHGFSLGVSDYVTKPFNPTELKLRIKNQLGVQYLR